MASKCKANPLVGISRFQSNFLRKKLLTQVNNVNKYIIQLNNGLKKDYPGTKDPFNDKQFLEHNDKFQGLLKNKELIKNVQSFMTAYYRFMSIGPVNGIIAPMLDARTFLCSWMVYGFPELILGSTKENLEKHKNSVQSYLYLNALEMIVKVNFLMNNVIAKKKMNIVNENIRQAFKQMNIYSNCFLQFKSIDIYNHINSNVTAWVNSSNTLDKVLGSSKYKKEKKDEIEKHMMNIMNEKVNMMRKMLYSCNVQLLTKEEKKGLKRQEMIKLANEKVENMMLNMKKIINAIPEQAKKASIDKLKTDIEKKEYDEVFEVLKTLRDALINYYPKKGKEKFMKEINEVFDMDYVTGLIKKECFTCKDIMGLCSWMVDKLTFLQAPYRAEEVKKEWNHLSKMYEEYVDPKSTKWETVGSQGLFFVAQLVNKLKEDLLRLEVMDQLFAPKY